MDIKIEPEDVFEAASRDIALYDNYDQTFVQDGTLIKTEANDTKDSIYLKNNSFFQTPVELELKIETDTICDEVGPEKKVQIKVEDPYPRDFPPDDGRFISEENTSMVKWSDVSPKHFFEIKIENNDFKKEDEDLESVKTSCSFGCSEDCGSGVDTPAPGLVARIILHRVPVYGRNFVCNLCFGIFPSAAERNLHKIIHTPSKCQLDQNKICNRLDLRQDRVYSCRRCPFKCTNIVEFKSHRRTHLIEKTFICDECEFVCKRIRDLNQHKMTHSGVKPIKCDECDYACRRRSHMKVHKMAHTGEKPFECDECNLAFTRLHSLKKHKAVHRSEKPFKCDRCDYCSKKLGNLMTHTMGHTGEKPYKCDECDFSCIRSTNLKLHKMRHTGEKPYTCDECDYSCSHPSNMIKHKMIHTGEKPYKCESCNFTCRLTSNMKVHRKMHLRN